MNPSIDSLKNNPDYTLVAELQHHEIKSFVLDQIQKNSRIIRIYLIYQMIMIALGALFLGISVIKAFSGEIDKLYYSLGAIVFSFTLLIIIHELIHGAAFKLVGVPKVTYGAILKQFVFYAEADLQVLNRKQSLMLVSPMGLRNSITILQIHTFCWLNR